VQTRGGDAFEGVAIMNMIRALPQRTEALIVGLAASAGSYIVQGADKVTMMPHSQMMIHRGSVLAIGQAPDMRMAADRLESIDKTMANIYAEKAGGTAEDWLAAMTPESWYTADEAVEAGLADGKRAMPRVPEGAKASLDLSVFAYAGREHAPAPFMPNAPAALAAPQAPAASADGSTETQERSLTVDFTDEQLTTMRQQLGLPEDADAAAIIAAQAEALTERADPPAATATPTVPEGSVVVSQSVLDELRIAAQAGQEARAVQLRQDRDDTINAAIASGHITPARQTHWTAQWDADAEGTRAAIASLTAGDPLFPVGKPQGFAGDDGTPGGNAVFTDAEAAQLAQLTGGSKEALLS
jgi:hypothetical protein